MFFILERIKELFGERGTYIALNPDVIKKLVIEARESFKDYEGLAESLGCSHTYTFRYKRGEKIAISVDKIVKLLEITNSSLRKEDISYIQKSRSGYRMPSDFIFSEIPWRKIDGWSNYLLGAIATDGNVHKGVIGFKISPDDVEFSAMQAYCLLRLAERIHGSDASISVGIDKGKRLGKPTTSIALSSTTMTIFFEHVLKVRLGTGYNVPHWLNNDRKSMFSWLGGITDGDGNVWKSGKNKDYWFWRIFNGSIEPLNEISQLVNRLVEIKAIPRYEGKGKYVFAVQKLDFCKEIFPKVLPYIIIERKRENIIRAIDDLEDRGYEIEIPDIQRNTRNPVMDRVVDFLRERDYLNRFQNWEKLECYGKVI